MSEQYPLLYDDLSEEDQYSPHFHSRFPMSCRGRAKNHVKGAAAIFARWPEHWTSLLTYWWIGLGMIALSTFIIYNSLFSYAMLHTGKPIMPKSALMHKLQPATPHVPHVFMHIFVDNKQEADLNKYLPYIEIVSNKYPHFKYELMIVANDTNTDIRNINDEENNELALNKLWTDDFHYKKLQPSNSNLHIRYVTLSSYLSDSPLKKYWRTLPHQFMKFLVRVVSVWEKGGIAFDPIVLTPQSPHSAYIEKIQYILQKYKSKNGNGITFDPIAQTQTKKHRITRPRVNNIRDVITALENQDVSEKTSHETLAEAESMADLVVAKGRKLLAVIDKTLLEKKTKPLNSPIVLPDELNEPIHKTELNKEIEKQDSSSKYNILPLFLDYLFHNKQNTYSDETTTNSNKNHLSNILSEEVISPSVENDTILMRNFWTDVKKKDNYRPMIISAQGIFNSTENLIKNSVVKQDDTNLFEVTIDLKGNIIATETPCHAFIGSVFSNAVHHDQSESVTDFIIKELSIFCKGLLASCVGIDVILL